MCRLWRDRRTKSSTTQPSRSIVLNSKHTVSKLLFKLNCYILKLFNKVWGDMGWGKYVGGIGVEEEGDPQEEEEVRGEQRRTEAQRCTRCSPKQARRTSWGNARLSGLGRDVDRLGAWRQLCWRRTCVRWSGAGGGQAPAGGWLGIQARGLWLAALGWLSEDRVGDRSLRGWDPTEGTNQLGLVAAGRLGVALLELLLELRRGMLPVDTGNLYYFSVFFFWSL